MSLESRKDPRREVKHVEVWPIEVTCRCGIIRFAQWRQNSDSCPKVVSLCVERRDEVAASRKAGSGTDSIDIGSIAGASVTGCSVGHSSGSRSTAADVEGRNW